MITKGKTVIFYKWLRQKDGVEYNVVGERESSASGLNFNVYKNKEKIEDKDGKLILEFVTELSKTQK